MSKTKYFIVIQNEHLKFHSMNQFSEIKENQLDISSTAVAESVFSVDLDFCNHPETSSETFIKGTTTIVNTFFPPKDHPGYSKFMTQIFVALIKMTGTDAGGHTSNGTRFKVFLECFLIAAGQGMKDRNSEQRKSLECFAQQIMSRPRDDKLLNAIFDLLRDFIHTHELKKPTN